MAEGYRNFKVITEAREKKIFAGEDKSSLYSGSNDKFSIADLLIIQPE